MRRSGSAAPQSSWSPTVNAERYSASHVQLAQRPIGHVERAGDRGGREALRASPRVGWERPSPTRWRSARMRSISASGTSRFSLMVRPWLWQRMAPTRTHRPSTGIGRGLAPEDLVGLGVALPLLAALAVVQVACRSTAGGCRRAGRRSAWSGSSRRAGSPATSRSMSRIADAGSSSRAFAAKCDLAHLLQQLAHVLRAGARGGLVGHGAHPLHQVGLEAGRRWPSASGSRCSCRRCSSSRPTRARGR